MYLYLCGEGGVVLGCGMWAGDNEAANGLGACLINVAGLLRMQLIERFSSQLASRGLGSKIRNHGNSFRHSPVLIRHSALATPGMAEGLCIELKWAWPAL